MKRNAPIENSCAGVNLPASMSACAMREDANVMGGGGGGGGAQLVPLAQVSVRVYWPPLFCSQVDATIRYSPVCGSAKLTIFDWQVPSDESSSLRVSSVPRLPIAFGGP